LQRRSAATLDTFDASARSKSRDGRDGNRSNHRLPDVKCPFCSHLESKVIDSRASAAANVTRRRRECEKCDRRFTTYERVEEVLPLIVKKDGRRETFDRQKVVAGLGRACDKRAVTLEAIEAIVDTIERDLIDTGERELSTQIVGEKIMGHLKNLDEVAYVRFASVYRSFRTIDEFMSELAKMVRDKGTRGAEHSRPSAADVSEREKKGDSP
jgi:transcriptional repressor NrdR